MSNSGKVNYTITRDNIHLNLDGMNMTLNREHRKYGEVRELIKEGRLDEIKAVLEQKEKTIEEYVEGSGLFLSDQRLVDSEGKELPIVLSVRMQELKDEGFSIDRLVKFWENLKLNPSMNSRNQLFAFLEQNGHPLTDDGHFIAYRGIRADFKDMHTGTFDNSPGSICEMAREDVDDNPNQTCSKGLHVAAFSYADSFGPVTVEVKVNPRDVVAVPSDYNGQKMRVCRFEVVQVTESMRDEAAYGSSGNTMDWDEPEVELYNQDDVALVIELAKIYKERYKDRLSLAARVEEEVDWLDMSLVLEIINDNESSWDVDDDDSDDEDELCDGIDCQVCDLGLPDDDDDDDGYDDNRGNSGWMWC